jgi:hypothetical protein
MSQFLALSIKDKKLIAGDLQECSCNLTGTILKVDNNNKVSLLKPKKVSRFEAKYCYLVLWKIGDQNWEVKYIDSDLSSCFCKFYTINVDKLDTRCKEIEIIFKVSPKNEIDIQCLI